MPEDAGPQLEKMSDEERAELLDAILEFYPREPHRTLGQLAGLRVEAGAVEEEQTNRKPPTAVAPDAEIIAIDECLGLYRPGRKRIVLFLRGVAAAAKILNCEAEELQHVVRYHEWGHAALHVGLDKDGRACDVRHYNRIDQRVHESLAQLLAWLAIEENMRRSRNPRVQRKWNRMKDIFTKLEGRQPPEYRGWRRFQKLPVPKLQKVLILIRRGTRFGDWQRDSRTRWLYLRHGFWTKDTSSLASRFLGLLYGQ
jgi:hypothetical protein